MDLLLNGVLHLTEKFFGIHRKYRNYESDEIIF